MSNEAVRKGIERLNTEGAPDISLAQDFIPKRTFQLYVGVAGIVKAIDFEGNIISRYFVAGYHPVILTKVYSTANGTEATDLGACWTK